MNTDFLEVIIDIYYSMFNTCIIDTDKLVISSTENDEHFGTLHEMIAFMLEDILLGINNILWM